MKEIINNNIEEQRVGFPNAKLLKEKGLKLPLSSDKYYFSNNGNIHPYSWFNAFELADYIDAPTQQVAIDWIRINFNIDITCCIVAGNWYGVWIHKNRNTVKHDIKSTFLSPEEAKEAVINYVLTKMI